MKRIVDATKRRRRRFVLCVPFVLIVAAAFLISGSAVATTTGCSNTATLAGSAFEIDTNANLVVNTTGCIDWLDSGSFRTGVLENDDTASGAGDESFGQGTAEDNPNPTIVSGSIPPNKSDLKAFGVFTEDAFLELFWSRVQNPSGTTNMDFELNHEFCDGTATHCANNGTSKNPVYVTPKRTTGDKLITYDLSKGGTVPGISVRTWNGSAWGTANVISGGSSADALGSVNTSGLLAANTGGLGSQDAFTFGEAAISFEALFGSGACGTFGSAYLKSRSSDSFTSEIKDFVPPERVQVSNCPSGLTTTATASVTVGGKISDTAHLTVGDGAGGSITFHLWSDSGCTTEVNTGLSAISVDGPGDYNSGDYTTTAAGTYYWTAEYSGDASNDGSSTACGDPGETSVVNKANSSIATTENLVPNDTASITPSTATGSVDFYLFKPGQTCSVANQANAVLHQSRSLSSGSATTNNASDTDTLAGSHAGAIGTWKWIASYSGNAGLNGSDSICAETFSISH